MKDVKDVTKLKHITVSEDIYFKLKRLGGAGDSFNDVITKLLEKKELEEAAFEKVMLERGIGHDGQ